MRNESSFVLRLASLWPCLPTTLNISPLRVRVHSKRSFRCLFQLKLVHNCLSCGWQKKTSRCSFCHFCDTAGRPSRGSSSKREQKGSRVFCLGYNEPNHFFDVSLGQVQFNDLLIYYLRQLSFVELIKFGCMFSRVKRVHINLATPMFMQYAPLVHVDHCDTLHLLGTEAMMAPSMLKTLGWWAWAFWGAFCSFIKWLQLEAYCVHVSWVMSHVWDGLDCTPK